MRLTDREPRIAVGFFLLASAAILLTRLDGGVALLWVADAPLLAYLCRTPPARWRPALLVVMLASLAASTLFGPVLAAAPFLALASVAEAVVCAALLRRWLGIGDYFRTAGSVLVFGIVAGLVAPMTGGLLSATVAWIAFPRPWVATYVDWVVGHGLGTLIAMPIAMLVMDREQRGSVRALLASAWGANGALLLGVAAVTAGVFLQQRLPLLFLPALPILLATFKMGRPGAAWSIVIVAAIGWAATASGHGPIMLASAQSSGQLQFFQLYLAATFVMSLPVAGALGQRAQLANALAASDARHRRIVERSQDVIFETDAQGRWTFLSDAWTRLTGEDNAAAIGQVAGLAVPEGDRSMLAAAAEQARDGATGMAEIRFIRDGNVRWAAVNIALLRDADGQVTGSYGSISDITRRKEAEAAILASERRYRMLSDNISDMIARIGLDGTFRSVTPAAERLLGMAPYEVIGTNSLEQVLPDYRGVVEAACAALLHGGGDQTCSYRQYRRGTDPLWVESVFRLIRDDQNRPVEFIVSVRDIARRKLLEAEAAAALQQVNESNRLFGMAGALAGIGHWRFDVATASVIWSEEVFRIHGLDVAGAMPPGGLTRFFHPDDRERVEDVMAVAIAEGRPFEVAARLVLPDGTIRHVVSQGQVEADDAGEMAGMFGVIQDVTDRAIAEATLRDSEARFRLITEQASDMIAVIDMAGVCLFMSPASAAILGEPPERLVGTRLIERTHVDDRPAIIDYWRAINAAGNAPTASIRFRMAKADGDCAWLEASSRLATIGGESCAVTVWRDVSHQVAIEAELKTAKAEAEAAAHAKAGFLANMSHEIRTPMNGVIGFAELLLASDLSSEQRRDATLIADSGRAMMKLLNDILDLSKIDAGQLDVVSEPFDLAHAVRACGKLLGPSAEQKHLGFRIDIADDVPRHVLGDPLRVRQIVLNLIGNAIKFTERGSVTVRAFMVEDDAAPQLAIAVRDTGIGIAADRQASIFGEFVQADHSITRRYGGTGLGLAISNRLATLMGGRIALHSEAGEGTKVTLLLPAVIASKPLAPLPAAGAPAVVAAARPCRILLAEDHEVNQLLVRSMLLHGDHAVEVVGDGEAAVAAVRNSHEGGDPFDLVLMDMQMPVMDGLAATRAIRAAEARTGDHLPIIALTANAFASDLELCRDAGMDDHLAKPVSMEALLSMVARWGAQAAGPAPAPVTPPSPPPSRFTPSAAARAKYADHRRATLDEVDALVRRGTFTDQELAEVADRLHKLAGTAGMFGEAMLGDRASDMEEGLLAWPAAERAARTAAAASLLREAA